MAPQYGEVRVDYITYTTGVVPNEGNATAYVSGLINSPTFSGNVIIEGNTTIDGNLNVSGDINASGVVISGITGLFDDGTETAPSIAFASDPDTGIYKPATNEIGFSTNGDEKLRIDSSGRLLVGTSSALDTTAGRNLQVSDANGAFLVLGRDDTTVGDGPAIGGVHFYGKDTTNNDWTKLGAIDCSSDGIQGPGDNPTRLVFSTTAGPSLSGVSSPTERLRIDSSGRVGIGTTSPDHGLLTLSQSASSAFNALVIQQGNTGSAATDGLHIGVDSGVNAYITHKEIRALIFGTANTERLRIDSSGRVGIGTTSPTQKLSLQNGTFVITGTSTFNSNVEIGRVGGDNNLAFATGGTERARIDSSGNVGIGTSSPSFLADLGSSTGTLDDSAVGIRIRRSGVSNSWVQLNNVGALATIDSVAPSPCVRFRTSTDGSTFSERLRIDSSGRVGIGTSSPGHSLTVFAPAGAQNIFLAGQAGVSNGYQITSDGTNLTHQWYNDGGEAMRIDSSGKVGIGTLSPVKLLHLSSGSAPTVRIENTTTSVSVSQILGAIEFEGNDASTNANGVRAKIEAEYRGIGAQTNLRIYVAKENVATPYRAIDIGTGGIVFNTENTERMRIDSSGRLLVGASSWSANHGLVVTGKAGGGSGSGGITVARGSVNIANNQPQGFLNFSDTDENLFAYIGCWTDAAGTTGTDTPGRLVFATTADGASSPTERLRIDSSGRVGIGTSSPDRKLSVSNTSGDGTLARFIGPTNNLFIDNDRSGIIDIFSSGAGDDLAFGTQDTERLRIDSSGRLLVGTTTSRSTGAKRLVQIEGTSAGTTGLSIIRNSNDVFGSEIRLGKSRGISNNSSAIVSDNDTLAQISFSAADGADINSVSASISAQIDGTPGANDMPGRLVFSTTSDGASSPTERMRIDSSGQFSTFFATNGITARSAAAAGTTSFVFRGMHSGTNTTSGGHNSFYVYTNGNVQNTNNSYGAISDIKLKENIVDASSQWDDLKSLRVVNYNFKTETGFQTYTQLGLIAQEVELISPGLVSEFNDTDGENNDLGTTTKSVNYSVLYMKAVKALQEAMERIETLEQRLTDAGL